MLINRKYNTWMILNFLSPPSAEIKRQANASILMVEPQTNSLSTSIVNLNFFGSVDLPWHSERSQWGTLTTSSSQCIVYSARSHTRLVFCAWCMLHDVDVPNSPHTADTSLSNFMHKIGPHFTDIHTQGAGNNILCISLSEKCQEDSAASYSTVTSMALRRSYEVNLSI